MVSSLYVASSTSSTRDLLLGRVFFIIEDVDLSFVLAAAEKSKNSFMVDKLQLDAFEADGVVFSSGFAKSLFFLPFSSLPV
jgi:hypothetical protein